MDLCILSEQYDKIIQLDEDRGENSLFYIELKLSIFLSVVADKAEKSSRIRKNLFHENPIKSYHFWQNFCKFIENQGNR